MAPQKHRRNTAETKKVSGPENVLKPAKWVRRNNRRNKLDDPQKQKPPRIENACYKRRRHSARETSQDDPQKQKPPRIKNAC